ncbi:glycosyltransferase [Bacillus cereus group sp. BfR-BA-01380]|uniref:glycosyltransferase n=1 Tax=Bacillus cereus group sp. BfR-BA-01380 TaxID=2920324 RepID=UPI001F55B53A|nr:glycosyltransferase [Bacillus cereus group sp. BfR-BA-01380]
MLKVSRFIENREIIRSHLSPLNPAVSVIMPTYRRGAVSLRRAIESVLNQTFTSFEFIIIDDGSRDHTFQILKEYQAKDHRIVIIRHHLNSGLPALRVNEGIIEARGKYISYQFDDDEYLPDCLQTLYHEIIKYAEPCLVYGNCQLHVKDKSDVAQKILGKPFNYGLLVNGNYIANNSVLHHKVIFESTGMYDPHIVIRRFSDWDLWLRMSKKFPFYWIDKPVTKAFAGEKHALGTDIGFKLSYIRKYIESFREKALLPKNICQYDVDNLEDHCKCFNALEIDTLNRTQIIPYRCNVPYYLTDLERYTANITRPHKRTIAVTKPDFSTSVDVTIRNYTHRINNFPYDYFFVNEAALDAIHPSDYSLLILSRTIGPNSTKLLEENVIQKKPTAYFMDDNMFRFHELGEEFEYLKPHTVYYKNLEYQVSNSHLVGSYNPIISADCKKYNKSVAELNTNIPYRYFQKKYKRQGDKAIKIAIFSGPARKNVLKTIWTSLEQIAEKYGNAVEFHFWGLNPKEFGELKSPVYYVPFTHSYDKYIERLIDSYFDYHICPLDGIFQASLSKSPVKFLEGTISGAVGIFSNVEPYKNIPNHLCLKAENTLESWYETIDHAIRLKSEKRSTIYEEAYNYIIQNYSTEAQMDSFLSTLEATELIAKLNKRKIAYFFHESDLGGATIHLLKHALMAKSYGIEIMICLPHYQKHIPTLPQLLQKHNLNVHYLHSENFIEIICPRNDDLHYAKGISTWLKENNIGLVHSVTFFPSVGIACKMNKIPHVSSLHKFYSNKASKEFLINNILIDIVHSSSSKYANVWSEELHVPSRKIVCPVDEIYFKYYMENKEKQRENNKPIKILIPGTLKEGKNQHTAIKAVSILKKKGYSVQLDLIGYHHLIKDYTDLCHSIIQDKELSQEVKIRGFTNTPQDYYANTDILLCSSTEESMPQTILKAMASGALVVSTDVGGVKELIKDNYSGIIADGVDENALATALERAFHLSAEQRTEIITNAFKIINMVGDPQYVCTELLNLYNEAFDQEQIHKLPDLLK